MIDDILTFRKEGTMYIKELSFIQNILKSTLGIHSIYLTPPYNNCATMDLGLRKHLFKDYTYSSWLSKINSVIKDNIAYNFTDHFHCCYAIMKLPDTENEYLVIGPFLIEEVSPSTLNEIIVSQQLSSDMLLPLKNYYEMLPIVDSWVINSSLTDIATFIFGGKDNFRFVFQIDTKENGELLYNLNPNPDLSYHMTILEERYKLENAFMEAVSKGDRRSAFTLLNEFMTSKIDNRTKDPIRNMKNHSIILNTLLRKSAERSFVHPYYLDEISKKFSIRIETLYTLKEVHNLWLEMTRKYCLLVKNHSLQEYSPLIRKTIDYININLSSPLSLSVIANDFNVNASYLSSSFKKEMGMTITDYINGQRVNTAISLLNTTDMNIQTISWHVGIQDVSYFTRIFKKAIGITPTQYRQSLE